MKTSETVKDCSADRSIKWHILLTSHYPHNPHNKQHKHTQS